MPESINPVEIAKEAPATPEVTPEPVEIPLVQRVSKFMETNDPSKAPVQVPEDFKFDINEIAAIEDPAAREVAEKAYKSFQRGFNAKFQEIAELRKALEIQGKPIPEKWTPERIQQLINDPEFINAAQVVTGNNPPSSGLTDEEFSALNPTEQAQLTAMKQEIVGLKQIHMAALKTQQDAELKQTYANYEPQKVDGLLSDMMQGRTQATREHLWKVLDYDPAIERAYKLGRQDERSGNVERISSMSVDGIQAQPNQNIQPEQNESNLNFWKRLASKRLAESKSSTKTRM